MGNTASSNTNNKVVKNRVIDKDIDKELTNFCSNIENTLVLVVKELNDSKKETDELERRKQDNLDSNKKKLEDNLSDILRKEEDNYNMKVKQINASVDKNIKQIESDKQKLIDNKKNDIKQIVDYLLFIDTNADKLKKIISDVIQQKKKTNRRKGTKIKNRINFRKYKKGNY